MKEEAYPPQYFEKEAKLKNQEEGKVAILSLPSGFKREALDRDYEIYLKNRGHQELIEYYEQAADYGHQVSHSRSSDHKKLAQAKYDKALKNIFLYETEKELTVIRDNYVIGGTPWSD